VLWLRVAFADANGNRLGTVSLGNVRGVSGEWKSYAVTAKPEEWPEGAATAFFFFGWIGENGMAPTGEVYLDDISLLTDDALCM